MDKDKQPGISFHSIDLFDCRIGNISPKKELTYNLRLTQMARSFSDDKLRLVILFGFDLMGGIENPPFEFKCSFIANYSREENSAMSWDEFTDAMALTHVVPFLREFLSNITNRMPLPTLILPPTNVFILLEEFANLHADSTTPTQSETRK